jgi:hypothetical protein
MNRIHIVGISPRTGTTLLAECMRTCFEIDASDPHEARLSKCRWGAEVYLTKRPRDICIVRPRLRVDPRLSVICMMRDPRDVIVSRHAKDPSHFYASLSTWKSRLPYVRRLHNHPRFVLIRYEDFVDDPDACQRQIMQRIPYLRQTSWFSEFGGAVAVSEGSTNALGGVRSVGTDRVGNWQNNKARVAGQLLQHGPISRELIEFGYERDASWLSLMQSVIPDLTPSYQDLHARDGLHRLVLQSFKARLHAAKAFMSWALRISWG